MIHCNHSDYIKPTPPKSHDAFRANNTQDPLNSALEQQNLDTNARIASQTYTYTHNAMKYIP